MSALDFKRNNARAYIASDPTVITFLPRERVSDGAGGFTWSEPDPLAPQGFRMISSGATTITRRTVDGKSVLPDLLIMGPWDAQISEGWTFSIDTRDYEVVYILPDIQHCVLAEVVRRG